MTSPGSESAVSEIATRIVDWQKVHGRNDLPWQNTRDPYRVWLSEIMLQQTQVSTVLNYFPRFLARFPDVGSLAAVSLDEVLGLWSGLGYYSRARNLHRCALTVMDVHGGVFPQTAVTLQTLPGIGRSTAAAIASLCFGERVAILDGNVKRVLTRVLGFDADLALSASERRLWNHASQLLPIADLEQTMPRYTQGVMDLGATVCTSKKPTCILCPLADECVARRLGQPELYPVKSRKIKRSVQSIWLLWAQTADSSVFLSRRPVPGVWGGLFCFPMFDNHETLEDSVPADLRPALDYLPAISHTLTHKDLILSPVRVTLERENLADFQGIWADVEQWPGLGLPAPVRKLLLRE